MLRAPEGLIIGRGRGEGGKHGHTSGLNPDRGSNKVAEVRGSVRVPLRSRETAFFSPGYTLASKESSSRSWPQQQECKLRGCY